MVDEAKPKDEAIKDNHVALTDVANAISETADAMLKPGADHAALARTMHSHSKQVKLIVANVNNPPEPAVEGAAGAAKA
jgi:hypothetical protein